MISILYEDNDVIVVEKPAGLESQSGRGFEPDMVSQIRAHIHKLSPNVSTKSTKEPPYVGVIHRLDKPVRGVMVYAKTRKAAAGLSAQLQAGKMQKTYAAVVCGKPVDNCGTYVDYLLKNLKSNQSQVVDKSVDGAKRSELVYRVLDIKKAGRLMPENPDQELSLLEIELLTGRYHQIRAQMTGHGTPLFGDNRYGTAPSGGKNMPRRPLALCARRLTFTHPVTGKEMTYEIKPSGGAFGLFETEK